MKRLLLILSGFFIFLSLLVSQEVPIHWIQTFDLQGEQVFRVSLETNREREGRMPVVLSFGGLEASLMMNTGNRAAAVDGGNFLISEILVGDTGLFFTVYEQNPVRTRMRLSDKNEPVVLKIDREKERAEFYIGGRQLKLDPIQASFRVIAPVEQGLYELYFEGTNGDTEVHTYKRFIFRSAAGIIYAVPPYKTIVDADLKNSRVWAVEMDQTVFKKGGRR